MVVGCASYPQTCAVDVPNPGKETFPLFVTILPTWVVVIPTFAVFKDIAVVFVLMFVAFIPIPEMSWLPVFIPERFEAVIVPDAVIFVAPMIEPDNVRFWADQGTDVKLELLEISAVPIPANPSAIVIEKALKEKISEEDTMKVKNF